MEKIFKSLSCPFCMAEGKDVVTTPSDKFEQENQGKDTVITIKRTYECHCKKCDHDYQVDYGQARLIRYQPFIYVTNDDIKIYIDYESEFDRSYKIIEVNDIPMIITESDDYPIIVGKEKATELIEDYQKAKEYAYNIWMDRYR